MKARTAPQGAARGALAGAYPTPAIGLPLSVGLAFWDEFAWAGDTGGGGGGGTGDFVGPASSTDLSIVQFDGTTGKLGKVAPVKITGAGAMVPDADGTQQLGNHSFTWAELWAKQVTNKVQASVQAPSPGWSTSYAAFWTKTGGLPQHTYNGTDRQLALAGANSDITSLSGLTTALSIGQGGTGQTTAAGAFGALKQDATAAASGVVELGTYGEGQTAGASRVPDLQSVWEIYRPGYPEWGTYRCSATGGTVTASGAASWGTVTVVGTFTKTDLGSTYGWVWGYPLSTSTSRGMYTPPGNFTFDSGSRIRHIGFFGSATVGDTRMCIGWAASGATLGANIGTVTANVRFGIIDGTIYGICANGTTESRVSFSHTPVNSRVYGFEIIPNRGNTTYTFRLYTYTEAGGPVWQETQTVSASIPTGGSTMGPAIFALARTGTPTAYILGADSVVNLTT